MKLRLVIGSSVTEPPPAEGLRTLYRTPTLLVQGDSGIQVFHEGAGPHAFLAGEMVGSLTSEGRIEPASSHAASWRRRMLHERPTRCRELFEGRYLLVVADPDGSGAVITDRFGQMDLYYHAVDDTVACATDLSLLPLSDRSVAYDQAALAHTLCVYGYRPPKQHTIYRGVRRLGVDQWMVFRAGRVEVRTQPFEPTPTGPYGERELNQYADLLLDAVAIRASRRGNVVSLSSGWDSTALLACLLKVVGPRKVRAVTARMRYASRSGVINQFEIDRARAMAEYFGIRLDLVDLDYDVRGPDLLERIRPVIRAHQLHGINAVSLAILMERIARTGPGDEAVFVGEISDGAHNLGFSQFTTIFHPALEFREYSDKMASYLFGPTALGLLLEGRLGQDPVYGFLRGRRANELFDDPAADALSRRRQLLASFFLRNTRVPFWSLRNCRLLTAQGREAYSEEMEHRYLRQAAEEVTASTLYAWYLHLYNTFFWQSSPVASRAVIAESCGLSLAVPFWDSRLQRFLSAMPEAWGRGLDLNPTKYPLKWTLRHRVDYPFHLQTGPHSYRYDVDPSFNHSAEILYGSMLKPYLQQQLQDRPYRDLLSEQVFDLSYLDAVVGRYLDGTEVRGAELTDLWAVASLMMAGWYGPAARTAAAPASVSSG